MNVLADKKVLYHGHAVAAVAAHTEAAAEAALELIDIDYEPLTPVMDLKTAMAQNAPLLHDTMFTSGLAQEPTTPSNICIAYGTEKR